MDTMRTLAVFSFLFLTRSTLGVSQTGDSAWTVYLRRAGPIAFGMTVSQATAVLHDPSAGLDASIPGPGCHAFTSNKLPEHVSFMVVSDTIVGLVVDGASVRTAKGAGIGDTEDHLRALYGHRLQTKPHPLWPHGHYLAYAPTDAVDRPFTIIFETDGTHVLSFRAGLRGVVDSIAECP
jgi:hypothetical protein